MNDTETREGRKVYENLAAVRKMFEVFVVKCSAKYSVDEYITVVLIELIVLLINTERQPKGPYSVSNDVSSVVKGLFGTILSRLLEIHLSTVIVYYVRTKFKFCPSSLI